MPNDASTKNLGNLLNPCTLRLTRDSIQASTMYMHEIAREKAKARFMSYVAFRSEKFHLKNSYVAYIRDKVIPIQRRLKAGFALRKQIKEYLRTALLSMHQTLNEMNPNAKKHRKIKDMLKKVKTIEDFQMDNIIDLVNKIYIQRHKLKMIWFMINKTVEKAKELEDEDDDHDDPRYEESKDE